MKFSTLIDTPDATTLADGTVQSTIQVAKLGAYKDRRYGEFSITREDYEGWQRNLAEHFGQVPIDYDHAPEKGKGTEAAAWITNVKLDGDRVLADVTWTPQGAQAVRDGRWRYISPTFVQSLKDETGTDRGRALIGAGLTNRPFLRRDMPTISLSVDAGGEFAEVVQDGSDSRHAMKLPANIAKALSLDTSTDYEAATILDALDGKVILDSGEHAELTAKADRAVTLEAEAAEAKFTTAFTKALDEGRATPAQEEALRAIPVDAAVKILESAPQVVSTSAKGANGTPPETPKGVDADRHAIHLEAERIALAENIDYAEAALKAEAALGV